MDVLLDTCTNIKNKHMEKLYYKYYDLEIKIRELKDEIKIKEQKKIKLFSGITDTKSNLKKLEIEYNLFYNQWRVLSEIENETYTQLYIDIVNKQSIISKIDNVTLDPFEIADFINLYLNNNSYEYKDNDFNLTYTHFIWKSPNRPEHKNYIKTILKLVLNIPNRLNNQLGGKTRKTRKRRKTHKNKKSVKPTPRLHKK
jgi:hypothetical protein